MKTKLKVGIIIAQVALVALISVLSVVLPCRTITLDGIGGNEGNNAGE